MEREVVNNTWSTWLYRNLLTHVRMPDSFGWTIGLCIDESASITGYNCLMEKIVTPSDFFRVGAKAIDFSYKGR